VVQTSPGFGVSISEQESYNAETLSPDRTQTGAPSPVGVCLRLIYLLLIDCPTMQVFLLETQTGARHANGCLFASGVFISEQWF
jgi:hypothetical protein